MKKTEDNVNKTSNDKKSDKLGMYVSLSLCLVAIALAAWGTFYGVSNFMNENVSEGQESSQPLASLDSTVNSEEESTPPTSSDSNTDEIATSPITNINEKFSFPVKSSAIISDYSGHTLVYNEVMRDYRVHSGVDFAAAVDEPVYSSNNGTVEDVYYDLLLGNVVIIKHGDYEFWYCGLGDDISVKAGDTVTDKQEIGLISVVPFESNTSHLHLQVKKDGEFINPLSVEYKEES